MHLNIRQSPQYAKYLEKLNWKTGKEKKFQYFIRKIPFLGFFVKIPRPSIIPSELVVDSLAKKHNAFAVSIDYSPTKTLQLDISQSLEKILNQMSKDTRYGIRKAENNHLNIQIFDPSNSLTSPLSQFVDIWHENAKRRGFLIPFKKEIESIYEAFGKNSSLVLAYDQISDSLLSGALIIFFDKTAFYFHAASTPEGRKKFSPYLVVWETIKLAKKNDCTVFDFEGIQDPRDKYTKTWGGFTHFKRGFGGKEIEYPLTKTKYYNRFVKFLFSFYR